MDVVVANTYAKSLLRAVAQEWTSAHDNVHYFPSYEIVQNSDRAATWEPDLRHVKGPERSISWSCSSTRILSSFPQVVMII